MFTLKSAAVSVAVVAAVILGVSFHARANVPDTSYLTFSRAVSLPGVTLPAGTYIFERADQNVPDIVRVLSRDRKKVYLTTYTISIPRPQGLGDRVVLFGEAAGGIAPPVRAWFPAGEVMGHQFNYDR
jgi:hypothetical protein